MPATDPAELFDVFNASGEPVGQAPRGEVHRTGLWHRSTHVFLYDGQGRLLLQQRSMDKDLYAGAWDYSVGEHLQPGESYHDAALRGLREELAIALTTLEALGEPTASEFHTADGESIDREFQQAYRGVLDSASDDAVHFDPTEVSQIRWFAPAELAEFIARHESQCTPWLLRDVARFNLAPVTGG